MNTINTEFAPLKSRVISKSGAALRVVEVEIPDEIKEAISLGLALGKKVAAEKNKE